MSSSRFVIHAACKEIDLLAGRPDNEGAVQAASIADETIGRVDFKKEMVAGDLSVVVVQAKMGLAALIIAAQEEVVRFVELELLAFLRTSYDGENDLH